MTQSDNKMNMLLREFATTLRRAREEETAKMWLTVYELKLLRDGMADLNAELRGTIQAGRPAL
jgi:hypothetical protein